MAVSEFGMLEVFRSVARVPPPKLILCSPASHRAFVHACIQNEREDRAMCSFVVCSVLEERLHVRALR